MYKGYEKSRFLTVSLYFGIDTKCGKSYNGRQILQCVPRRHGHGLGSSMAWVGLRWSEIFAYEMG